jgi:hypothetical protein
MSKILDWKAVVLASMTAMSPLSAVAIGNVTAGDVTFGYTNNFTTTSSNTVDVAFTGAGTGDMGFESWWFYRVSGGTQESAFANPDIELYSGSIGRLDWTDPAASGQFSAALSFEVFDSGTNQGNLFQNLRIVNTSGSDLTIDIFHYSDLDLGGSGGAGNDRAALGTNPDGIQINLSDTTQTAPIVGYGANSYRVTQYSQLLQDLTDTGVDNLGNTGLPLNNRDVTVGFQWSVTIGAGGFRDFMTQFGGNAPLLDPVVTAIPEPGTAILMGLGLLLLAIPPRDDAAAAE